MKKASALLMALVMLVLVAACGPSDATPASDGQAPAPTPAPAPAPAPSPPAQMGVAGGAGEMAAPEVEADDRYGGTLRVINAAEGGAAIGIPWRSFGVENLLLPPFIETLLAMGHDGSMAPRLVKEWDVQLDENRIVFTLNPDIYFHDGSPLTAGVVAWNILTGIEVGQYNQMISDVEVLDDLTFAVKFDIWSNSILQSVGNIFIISQHSFETNGEDWAFGNPIGTGPFVFDEHVHGQVLRGVRNVNYWQPGLPYLDAVEVHFLRDRVAQTMAFQAAPDTRIHVLNTNAVEQIVDLRDNHGFSTYELVTGPRSLLPSSAIPGHPLSHVEVRKAISYAIDRDALVAARGFGIMTPGVQLTPEWSMAALPAEYNLTFNPERGRELMAEAGFPDGFRTSMMVQPGVVDPDTAVAVQHMLEQHLGIVTDIDFVDAGGWAHLRHNGWDGLAFGGIRQFAFAWNGFNMSFDVAGVQMVSVERPPGWAEVLNAAQWTPEPDPVYLQALNRVFMEYLMAIPIINGTDNWIFQDNVHDTGYGVYQHVSLEKAWLSD